MFTNARDPQRLMSEILAAEHVRDERLHRRSDRLARIAGPFASTRIAAEYEPENRLYEYVAYVLPRASFSNPRVRIRSRRSGLPDAMAKAMQSVLNRLIVDLELRRALRSNCLDYLMDWGPMMIAPAPVPGRVMSGRPVWWPQAYALEPRHWFMDPLALRLDEARFAGHVYSRDKSVLIQQAKEEPGWKMDAVEALTEEAGLDKVYPDRRDAPARGEVAIYEVWVPEMDESLDYDPDDGYSGTIYTIGGSRANQTMEAYELRDPQPFWGPRWGPYRHATFLNLTDIPYGISPTIPAEAQLRDLAATSRAMLENAQNHKTMTTAPAGDPTAVAAIQARGKYVVPLKGSPDSIRPIEIGGVTAQQLTHYEMKAATLDRVLGMHDIQRGLVAGQGTASEVLTAQAASDVRISDIVQIYHDHVADVLRTLAWYAYHDDRFVIELEGMQIPNMVKPALRGGKTDGMTFDELELEIEPFSMEHESSGMKQQRTQRTVEIVNWLAQAVPMAPWLPWEKIMPEITEDTGLQEALEGLDVQAAVAWAEAQAGFEGAQREPALKVTSGRQSQGRPINVNVRPSGRTAGGGTGTAQGNTPQRMPGGKQQSPTKGRVR